jgi:regulator of sigma E protease
MHEFIVSLIAFIILMGLMVLVHELGHFVVAKLCGVRVEAFSFGFGPRLFGIKRGETDYKVCLLPLGGFVKMTGENPSEETHEEDPGSFTAHPRWQRMLIALAGPVSNFVLAFVLMVFYYGWVNEVPALQVTQPTIEWVTNGSAAAQAGIQPGDIVRRIENKDDPTWEAVYERLKLNPNQTIPVTVERNGNQIELSLHVPASAKDDDFGLNDAGLLPQYLSGPIGIHEVEPGTPAALAGLRAGDAIQSIDGHPFHFVTSLQAYLAQGQGKPVSLVVVRNGAALPPIVAQPAKLDSGWKLGIVTTSIPNRNDPLPWSAAIVKSTTFCTQKSLLIVDVLDRLIRHKVAASQLAGPLGIARVAGEAAETTDWFSKVGLAAMISLNLGILNLLPFPILDGGLILLLLIESSLRRDIGPNVKDRIYQTAFVLLLCFFVFVTFNDVARLPFFTHLKP